MTENRDIIHTYLLTSIHQYPKNNVACIALCRFLTRLTSWPKFCRTWLIFGRNQYLINLRLQTKYQNDLMKNKVARVLTRILHFGSSWPWPWMNVTNYRTCPRYHPYLPTDQLSSRSNQNCSLYRVNGENLLLGRRDLDIGRTLSNIELIRDIIHTYLLTNFHQY